jgi:hypothetical protein
MTLRVVFICNRCLKRFKKAYPNAKKKDDGIGDCCFGECPRYIVEGSYFAVKVDK